MPDSPMAASPYEVLGVDASADDEQLRRAFRRALRRAHPDTGGDPRSFDAVQRAWQQIGTPELRAAYASGDRPPTAGPAFSAPAAGSTSTGPRNGRPRARSHGHPGGWRRERYLVQMHEWAGRGVVLDDPYDPALVRSAPRELRHILADAMAEEATARTLSDLGIGFTVWHDVATDLPENKIDHVVLGPTGLYAMLSEDYGGPVRSRRGELIGDALDGHRPVHELAARARSLSRRLRVRMTALVIVLPDDALEQQTIDLGVARGAAVVAARQSALSALMRSGPVGAASVGGNELFDLRTRLTDGIRFV